MEESGATNVPGLSVLGILSRMVGSDELTNAQALEVFQWAELRLAMLPLEAREVDEDKGGLPIHVAVSMNAPESTLRALITAFPESLFMPNNDGDLPFDMVFEFPTRRNAIPLFHLFRSINEEAVTQRAWLGNLPLHRSVPSGYTLRFCWELLRHFPQHALKKNTHDMTPLQYLDWLNLPMGQVPSSFTDLNAQVPVGRDEVEHATWWMKALLLLMAQHYGCVPEPPAEERLYMFGTRPFNLIYDALVQGNEFLPLHAAIATECPLKVFKGILEAYPHHLAMQDSQGHLPLHWAANSSIN